MILNKGRWIAIVEPIVAGLVITFAAFGAIIAGILVYSIVAGL